MVDSTSPMESIPPLEPATVEAVRRQLERILKHPLFAHSRRYPALLRYVVEAALEGNTDHIKERSIGVLVFARSPSYDANADPIVRVTAGEIRKRLQQFYSEPEHTDDLRIVLPLGSYVPQFLESSSLIPLEPELEPLPGENEVSVQTPQQPSHAGSWPLVLTNHHLGIGISSFILILLVAGWVGHQLFRPHTPAGGLLERFWSSDSPLEPLLLCLPDISQEPPVTDEPFTRVARAPAATLGDHITQHDEVALADVQVVTRVARALAFGGRPPQIRLDSQINLEDLRERPVVLIGAFSNQWSRRALQRLPFRLKLDTTNNSASIIDTRTSKATEWAVNFNAPYSEIIRDYAIVARFTDTATGQLTIMVSGIGDNGTEAGGELLCTESGLKALSKWLDGNPATSNFEAVISADVVGGKSGPPKVLAIAKW